MNNNLQQLTETKSALIAQEPFIASLLYGLVQESSYDPAFPTAATDGEVIKVGDWFNGQPPQERMFVLAHEVLHCMFDHMGRSKLYTERGFGPDMLPYDADRMNQAQDYVINAILKDAGIGRMPEEGLYDPKYTADMLPDVVYTMLPASQTKPKNSGQPGADSGHGGFDQHLPKPGPAQDPVGAAQREQAIVAAANTAKAVGKLSGALARIVGEIIEPKKNWRDILKDMLVSSAGRDELSWAKPRRRSLALAPHIPMPGRTGFSMGTLVLAVDTSGSIGDHEMALFVGAMKEIVEQIRPREMHVCWWDTKACCEQVEDLDDLSQLHPVGGGGTVYDCAIDEIIALDLDPDAVVCLTDGYIHVSHTSVPWPHITATTGEDMPFGRNVKMEE